MSKVCPHCGGALDEGDRFCRACGAAVDRDGAAAVFVLKHGTASLEAAESPVQSDAPAETPRPGAQAETQHPPAAPTRREKRISKKLSRLDREEARAGETDDESDEDEMPEPAPKKRGWKGKLLSLLVALVLIGGLVGGLYLWQTVEQAAFAPAETAYSGFSQRSPAVLEKAFYPELYSAMTDLGYLSAGGYWSEQVTNWENVYGSSFTAAPTLKRATWVRGAEKEDYLHLLQTEYGISPHPRLLLRLDYTVSIHGDAVDATAQRSAYSALIGGKWYLLQEEF